MEVLRVIKIDVYTISLRGDENCVFVTIQNDYEELQWVEFSIPKDELDTFLGQFKNL